MRLPLPCALLVLAIAGATAATSLASRPAARAATVTLNASVGPSFVISLTDASGNAVTSLPAGEYTIVVNDQSTFHDFHLSGPGVDQATAVADVGTFTWNVTLQVGTYTFQCDPHQAQMKGSFQVTAAPVTTTTTAAPTPAVKPLAGAVGPGFTINLTSGGKRVTRLHAGRYAITISDRSPVHNFVLEQASGGKVERAITAVSFVGKKTTTLSLTKGRWEYYCKPHESTMHGSFTVS